VCHFKCIPNYHSICEVTGDSSITRQVSFLNVAIFWDVAGSSSYLNQHFGGLITFLFSWFLTLKMEVISSSRMSVRVCSLYLRRWQHS
jgi:hypothetical protein